MFGYSCISAVLLLLSVVSFWSTVEADENALTDSENKYLFDRLLHNIRSSENRQKALNDLIRNYIPVDQSTRNKNVLLQVLANLGNVPFDFGGPVDDPLASVNPDLWQDDFHDTENRQNLLNNQLDDLDKRWGSGPGPRGKRFGTDVNSRVRRRDGPGPRGKRQGPRGKKQGPRGKKEDEETEFYCLQTIEKKEFLCDCSNKVVDPINCQAIDKLQ